MGGEDGPVASLSGQLTDHGKQMCQAQQFL